MEFEAHLWKLKQRPPDSLLGRLLLEFSHNAPQEPRLCENATSQMFSMTAPGRILVNGQNQQPDVWLGEQMTLVPRQQVTVKASPSDAPESRDETSNGPQQGLQPHLDQGWESQGGWEDASKGQSWAFSWGPPALTSSIPPGFLWGGGWPPPCISLSQIL